jgi:hypothetical protein
MTKKLITLLEKVETEYEKSKLLDDIPAIVAEINTIFACIKATNSFDEAQAYFDFLMNVVCTPTARMWFVHGLDVGDELEKFISDFDRIDDQRTRKEIYDGIKDGTYSLSPEDEEISAHA